MSLAAVASRQIELRDGVRLEVVESARDSLYGKMDPRLRGDDGTSSPSSPRKRGSIPILLLHGFTGAASTWNELLPELGARRRVIALSLHGHGGSDAPDDPARYAAHRAAEDVLEVLDMLGIARVALLGYSMGARVALHTALAAPERIGALIVESGSPGIADDAERANRRAADDALATDIEHHGVEAFVDRWERL
ncbi:MAG TPA: alpha/beta fold hydrolase, partial [Gemmatimonadaceae bacterium]